MLMKGSPLVCVAAASLALVLYGCGGGGWRRVTMARWCRCRADADTGRCRATGRIPGDAGRRWRDGADAGRRHGYRVDAGIGEAAQNRPLAGNSVTQSSIGASGAAPEDITVEVEYRPGGEIGYRVSNGEWFVDSDDPGTQTIVNLRGTSPASGLTVTAVVALKGQGRETDASAGALTEGIAVAFHSDIESAADTDHLAWGSWTSVSEDAGAQQEILQGAFATGSDPFRQENLAGVTGTARYRGDVTGVYFEATATPSGGYSFGARATLEAGFGDAAALGTIGGRIDNFIVQTSEQGDYISRPATSVTLGRTAIGGADSGFFNGAATGTFEDSTALSGRWGGRFYGNGNAGGVPRSVAGTFGAASADETRGFIGGFGAERR